MQRYTARLLAVSHMGFQRLDHNSDPMTQYGLGGWHYELSQVMPPPKPVNRVMTGPFTSHKPLVNRHRTGVWIDVDMHPAMQVALEPFLKKLALTRTVPQTDPKEAVEDFEKYSPLVGDDYAKLNWLAKVLQLCGLKGQGPLGVELWKKHCNERFITGAEKPPSCLIEAALYCCSTCNTNDWRPIFDKCLKESWNASPRFGTQMWSHLLQCAGSQNDAAGVRLVLEEMKDVQADMDKISAHPFVYALNALSQAEHYEYAKQFLFNLSLKTVTRIEKQYRMMRGFRADNLKTPLVDNPAMFYHVSWHLTIRGPQQFSPRQLYFNYKPNFSAASTEFSSKSGQDVLTSKIEKWKEEGLLPEDYEFDGVVVDNAQRFRNTMRHEHWAKMPKLLKDKRYGYCGEH